MSGKEMQGANNLQVELRPVVEISHRNGDIYIEVQNQVLLRSDVLQNTQNFHLEFLDFVARKDRLAGAVKTRVNVANMEERTGGLGWKACAY